MRSPIKKEPRTLGEYQADIHGSRMKPISIDEHGTRIIEVGDTVNGNEEDSEKIAYWTDVEINAKSQTERDEAMTKLRELGASSE